MGGTVCGHPWQLNMAIKKNKLIVRCCQISKLRNRLYSSLSEFEVFGVKSDTKR